MKRKIKILALEDQGNWHRTLEHMLPPPQYYLHIVPNCEAAKLSLQTQSFDLVIANINLLDQPGLRDHLGFELLKFIADNYPNLPRIVVSGEEWQRPLHKFLPLGVFEMFHKQRLTRDDLVQAIEEAVTKHAKASKPGLSNQPRAMRQPLTDRDKTSPPASQPQNSNQSTSEPIPNSDSSSSWEIRFLGVPYRIDEGVHRDIINGLQQNSVLGKIFEGIRDYQGKLWAILSAPQDDRAYGYTADLWKGLWAQDEGLPPFIMIQLLAKQEYSDLLYKGYRDHVVHSFLVYLLGIYLYYSNAHIRQAMEPLGDQAEFLTMWKISALFHDIGYYLNAASDKATEAVKRLLLEQLQKFIQDPLRGYGELHEVFTLQDSDERDIRRHAASIPVWEVSSMSDLRKAIPPFKGHILDELDELVRGTCLADTPDGRYLHRYDLYTQMVDADTHPRFDDHGLLSAMILLGQYKYFHNYATATCKAKVLNRVLGIKPEARQHMLQLPEKIRSLNDCMRQAVAAIALHNVDVTCWTKNDPDWSKAREDPCFLTLDQYNLSCSRTPLAWLLALVDTLQCWERPVRTDVPLQYSLKHQEIRISCSPTDKITVAFITDTNRKVPASRFNTTIRKMERYMQDLDILEEG